MQNDMILYFSLVNYFKINRVRFVDHGLILEFCRPLRKKKGAMREAQPRMISKGATLSTYGHTNPIRRLYTLLISNWWLAIKSISKLPIFEDWKVRLIAAQTINHTFGRPSSQSQCRMFPEAPSHQASQT